MFLHCITHFTTVLRLYNVFNHCNIKGWVLVFHLFFFSNIKIYFFFPIRFQFNRLFCILFAFFKIKLSVINNWFIVNLMTFIIKMQTGRYNFELFAKWGLYILDTIVLIKKMNGYQTKTDMNNWTKIFCSYYFFFSYGIINKQDIKICFVSYCCLKFKLKKTHNGYTI